MVITSNNITKKNMVTVTSNNITTCGHYCYLLQYMVTVISNNITTYSHGYN